MKKNAIVFIVMTLATLSLLPAANLLRTGFESGGNRNWWQKSSLYSFDFMLPAMSRHLYPHGISIRPEQVIIGKKGWLLLGDQYARTMSLRRHVPQAAEIQRIRQVAAATGQWREWMLERGVSAFKFMIVPDKETVYPEFLPGWAHAAPVSLFDTLIAAGDARIFFDGRAPLFEAKSAHDGLIYYPYDSHWNIIGTAAFFQQFVRTFQREPAGAGLTALTQTQLRPGILGFDHDPDQAGVLNLKGVVGHKEIGMEIDIGRPLEIAIHDFNSGQLLATGDNPALPIPPLPESVKQERALNYKNPPLLTPSTPVLITSRNALNQKKVLWLRDSFGFMLSPLMAASFTDTLQVSFSGLTAEMFARLILAFQPDYVFVTAAERNLLDEAFLMAPP